MWVGIALIIIVLVLCIITSKKTKQNELDPIFQEVDELIKLTQDSLRSPQGKVLESIHVNLIPDRMSGHINVLLLVFRDTVTAAMEVQGSSFSTNEWNKNLISRFKVTKNDYTTAELKAITNNTYNTKEMKDEYVAAELQQHIQNQFPQIAFDRQEFMITADIYP